MANIVRILIVLSLVAAIGGSVNFMLIRTFVFLGAIYLANYLVNKHRVETGIEALYLYGYVAIAIIFNPIIPVYLFIKDKWIIIDILVIVFILFQNRLISKNRETKIKQKSFSEEYNSLSWKGNPFLDKFIPNRNIPLKHYLCYQF